MIRQSLLETDFSLDEEFGDANQLEMSWQATPIPNPLIEFLCELLKVNKVSTLSSIVNSNSFVNISLDNKDGEKTPLHLMTGHSIHERFKSRKLINLFNKAGLSASYNEIEESCRNFAQFTASASSASIALPKSFY